SLHSTPWSEPRARRNPLASRAKLDTTRRWPHGHEPHLRQAVGLVDRKTAQGGELALELSGDGVARPAAESQRGKIVMGRRVVTGKCEQSRRKHRQHGRPVFAK